MGTHIIWRNPSPPRRAEFKLRRLAGNESTAIYQVAGRSYQRPFELLRRTARLAAKRNAEAAPAPPGADLVSARW
jgi:hypothetical protein